MESEVDVGLLIPGLPNPGTSGRMARPEVGDGAYADENPMPGRGGGIGIRTVSVEAGVSTRGKAPTGGPRGVNSGGSRLVFKT